MTKYEQTVIFRAAEQVRFHRERAAVAEMELQRLVGNVIAANPNGLRDWARQIKISAQYACDIRHGRRKVSDSVLVRVLAMGKEQAK